MAWSRKEFFRFYSELKGSCFLFVSSYIRYKNSLAMLEMCSLLSCTTVNCSVFQIILCTSSINDVIEPSKPVLEKYYSYKGFVYYHYFFMTFNTFLAIKRKCLKGLTGVKLCTKTNHCLFLLL